MGTLSRIRHHRWSRAALAVISVVTSTLFLAYHFSESGSCRTPTSLFESTSSTNQTDDTRDARPDPCETSRYAVAGAPSTLACGMSVNALGGLGNMMGEYATLLALSELNNRPAVILPEMTRTLSLYFRITLPTIGTEERTFWEAHWTKVWLQDWMTPMYRNLVPPFTFLTGYPNSWTFYHHIRARVLREFRFHDHILSETQRVLRDVRRNAGGTSVTFVGVHNRRGNYVELMADTYHGVVADAGFLRKAFDVFEARYPDVVFLVVSDDMEWCRRNIDASGGNIFFVGGSRDPVYDLALLANCNHSVVTIGTFGFWSAYLAGGDTVYLSDFVHRNSEFLKVVKYEAFYLPEWTPIAANLSASEEP